MLDGVPAVQVNALSRRGSKLALLIFVCAAAAAYFAINEHYFTLDPVMQNRDALLAFSQAHRTVALGLAFAIYATALSLPTGTVLSLTLGFLFGRWVGSALVVIAGTLGATILFLAAR